MTRILWTLAVTILLLPAASRGQGLGELDLCYKAAPASHQPPFMPRRVSLEDRLGTLQFDVKSYASLCNPPSYPASAHQVGYKISPAKTKPAQAKFVKRDQV